MRWRFINMIKKMKKEGLFDQNSAQRLDNIINVRYYDFTFFRNQIENNFVNEMNLAKEDLDFLRNENTALSIQNAEYKYNNHNLEEEVNR